MNKGTKYVGLDVHKKLIAVAVADEEGGAPRSLGVVANEPADLRALMRRLAQMGPVECCYEAGPCGYVLQREMAQAGLSCQVVAPSLIPVRPGDRVKTDRRDARKLAGLLRAGELTAVYIPDQEHEALRDLSRAREAVKGEVQRHRQRLSKQLLRLGVRPPDEVRRAWTKAHRAWLAGLRLPQPYQQLVLEQWLEALQQAEQRLVRLTAELAKAAQSGPHAALITVLQALRGVGVITAVTLVAETGDLRRFRGARQLMGYSGMVSREYSSGGHRRQGSITKAGNTHLRAVLVEAAWHYLRAPHVGPGLKRRQQGQPEAIIALSWKAQQRLHRRARHLLAKGKAKQVAVVALARELLGFLWGLARLALPVTASAQAAG